MKFKHKLIIAYFGFGFLFSIYSWMFGDTAHRSFAYNLGMGLVWPAVMFPVVGQIIGVIIMISIIAIISFS